ncbi:MAG: hypothetical protein ABSD48_11185 [Armatimonadota bacterium]|jgi:hypothetical protein
MLHYVPGITIALVRDRVLRAKAAGQLPRAPALPTGHPYVYARNNPTSMVDPSGLSTLPPVIIAPGGCPIGYTYIPSPPGIRPSAAVCGPYKKCCGREGEALYRICMSAGDAPWPNCVRKCLLERWQPAPKCSYKHGGVQDHLYCWDFCLPECVPNTLVA